MKRPVDAIWKCMYVSILKVRWFHLILTNNGIYPEIIVEPTNIKLNRFLICYLCAQMGRQTGRGMEGRDKNVYQSSSVYIISFHYQHVKK